MARRGVFVESSELLGVLQTRGFDGKRIKFINHYLYAIAELYQNCLASTMTHIGRILGTHERNFSLFTPEWSQQMTDTSVYAVRIDFHVLSAAVVTTCRQK